MSTDLVDAATPPEAGDLSDEEVIGRVLGGEPALFELLMRRHNARMYRTIRAILRRDDECEDVMQQAYINAFRHLGQFHGDARFSTWLTRIAVNEAIHRSRRYGRVPEVQLSDEVPATMPSTTEPNPEHATYATELKSLLESALDALPEPYRVVFTLRALEGLSTAETAASLAINEDTVKTRLHRARGHLRGHIVERLGAAASETYAFHLSRCDRVVDRVLTELGIRR